MLPRKRQRIATAENLPRPRDVPAQIGYYMIAKEQVDLYLILRLMAVFRPNSDTKNVFDLRLYDWQHVLDSNISIRDYESLDKHPEFILYEGWWNKKTKEIHVKERRKKIIV